MGMIAAPLSLVALNEAEVTHGRVVYLDISKLPAPVLEKVKAMAKENGMSEKHYEAMIKAQSNPDFAEENIPDPSKRDGGVDLTDMQISLHGNDAIDGHIMHELEAYDKAVDQAILSSEDIVKAYNATIDAKFQDAMKHLEKGMELEKKYASMNMDDPNLTKDASKYTQAAIHKGISLPLAALNALNDDVEEMKEMFGLTDGDIKKMVCEAVYRPSDNPEEIKAIVNARIKYNNTVIGFFKSMLQINYNILGLTKDEAMTLSAKLSSPSQSQSHKAIKDVKSIIVKNSSKYKIGKASYDFRPLGMGCMFMTDEEVGNIAKTVELDRMIQMLTQYDAVVVGHGGSSSEEYERAVEYAMNQYRAIEQKHRDEESKERDPIHNEIEEIAKSELMKTADGAKLLKQIKELEKLSNTSYFDTEQYKQLRKMVDDVLSGNDLDWEKKYKELKDEEEKAYNTHRIQRDDAYRKFRELNDDLRKYTKDYEHKIKSGEIDNDEARKLIEKNEEIMHAYAKKIYEEQRSEIRNITKIYKKLHTSGNIKWTIQPIHTLKAGPFTDVNDLVRQLIKEGFKNINLVACNPGRHTLAKDILETKGVKIHHATTSLLAENAYWVDSENALIESAFAEVDSNIRETAAHLIQICESSGISYNDNEYLNECTEYFESGAYMNSLNEGVLSQAWAKLKELVKRALGFIVNIFKKLLEMVGKLIGKIKEFFKKVFGSNRFEKKLSKPIKSGVIMVENASLNRRAVSNWDDLQKSIVDACEKITRKIKATEAKQTTNMQELERFAERQSKSVNESSNPEMDRILSTVLGGN